MDVLTLATKQQDIYESYNFQRKPTKAGKQLPIKTRKTVHTATSKDMGICVCKHHLHAGR